MKYINREYGFEGRPPHFPDYYEETTKGPSISSDNYPKKNIIGAGLDSREPYGAMLIGEGGTRWGIKISCNIRGRWVSSEDYLEEIGRLYAVSDDGNFTYFSYGDMTATVVKYSKRALVMSIATIDSIKLRITFYLPKPCEGEIRSIDNIIKGAANHLGIVDGTVELDKQMSVFRERFEVVSEAKNKEYFTAKLYRKPIEIVKGDNSFTYEYDLQGKTSRLFIYAAVGDKSIFNSYPEEMELVEGTSMEEIVYSTSKIIGRGILGRVANGFFNSSLYHKVYNPYMKSHMYAESRTKLNKYFAFKGYELNIATIIAAYIGDFETAKRQIEYAVKDDILALLALWILYIRTRDVELVKKLYMQFSRVYIPKGDLVISRDKSEVAYCMEGSPLKEENNRKPMYSLDKSCLNLLNMDIMERFALLAGAQESALYAGAKAKLKEKINDQLWNPRLGIYMNRYVSGEFSSTIGATSFYPLIAGAVDGLDKLEKLLINYRDKKKFYGERMIPTLSKDHPEYGVKFTNDDGEVINKYHNYRGMIVPHINFLIYLGLMRYGVYDLSADLAEKSAKMWNSRYRKGRYEVLDTYLPGKTVTIDTKSFMPDTENIMNISDRHSLQGNLMALVGLSEMIDLEYFRDDFTIALRFGTLSRGENSLSRIKIMGRTFSINIDDSSTVLSIDNIEALRGEGGKFMIRNFVENHGGAEFVILAVNDISLTVNLPIIGYCLEPHSIIFNVPSGCNKISINNGRADIKKIY